MLRFSRIVALSYIGVCLLTLVLTALIGPLGYAPFQVIRGPERPPIMVTLWYGTEKKAWLEEAKRRFDATNPTLNGRPIQIQLKGLGSREIAERVVKQDWRGEAPPSAISPASGMWLDLFNVPVVRDGADGPRPLVLSPLVVVGWEERAKALWPNGPRNFWQDLHDAVANPSGWKAYEAQGAKETWGPVKLGHTSPLASNSGAQALLLLAYAFHNKTSGLTSADVGNPEFATWLGEIESGAQNSGESTGTFMSELVSKGPSQYDFGVVYENLALENMEAARNRQGQPLRIYYPPATLFSDHPFALLNGAWVTPEQRGAAAKFRDFLTSAPMQQLALSYGFRPADPNIAIDSGDADNPFKKYEQNGVQIQVAEQAATPPTDVVNALLALWQNQKR